MKKNEPFFRYVDFANGKATCYCVPKFEEGGDKPTSLEVRFARCAPTDQFNRKIGRSIAEGRYKKYGPSFVLAPYPEEEKLYDDLHEGIFQATFVGEYVDSVSVIDRV
jgi:hypothetical protein